METTMIPLVVLDDGRETWDRLADCKIIFVTPENLAKMEAKDTSNPMKYASVAVDAGYFLTPPKDRE